MENLNKNNEVVGMWEVRDEWRQLLCQAHDSEVNERVFFTERRLQLSGPGSTVSAQVHLEFAICSGVGVGKKNKKQPVPF